LKPLVLGILLLGLIGTLGCSAPATATPASANSEALFPTVSPAIEPSVQMSSRLDFVYFHPKRRCALCLNLEIQTKSFLENNYKNEMEAGKITFTSYELEDQKNAAMVKRYGALASQLFINTVVNGKESIQQIEKIWLPEIYDDGQKFDEYMKSIVLKGMEAVR
jgi:hypothetical protein